MNYNHSLCVWRPEALKRIYELAAAHLVSARHYPDSILRLAYEPDFLIRGVSLDTHRGVLMKLTFLHQITPSESPPQRHPLSDPDAAASLTFSAGAVVRGAAAHAATGRAARRTCAHAH